VGEQMRSLLANAGGTAGNDGHFAGKQFACLQEGSSWLFMKISRGCL
jgi:hypothetical protein